MGPAPPPSSAPAPMKHALFTAALLTCALVCYGLGLERGGLALLGLGAVCELWFWVRVVRR